MFSTVVDNNNNATNLGMPKLGYRFPNKNLKFKNSSLYITGNNTKGSLVHAK